MRIRACDEYISNRAWFRAVIGGTNMILRNTSALEFLELFDGYMGECVIDVYAENVGVYENINYSIINSLDDIDYTMQGNVLCSTFNQVVNDMLSDNNSDEQALSEALCNYYFAHNMTFEGLIVKPENRERFDILAEYAINYYSGG